jgi:hypothetical protein
MSNSSSREPLRGDELWRAQKKEIAQRNETARAAGARQRATQDAKSAAETADRARREMQRLRDAPETERP